jgi:decaprenyl-phosphate phosphoribosyltransferase
MGDDAGTVRATLGMYSANYLQYLRAVTTGVMLVAYCLWAFDKSAALHNEGPWFELSIVPFTMAILRYALLVDQGEGGAPEDLIFKDRPLQIFGLLWVVVFGIGIVISPGVH